MGNYDNNYHIQFSCVGVRNNTHCVCMWRNKLRYSTQQLQITTFCYLCTSFFFIEFARACHHIIWIRYSVIIDNVEWAPNTDRTNEQTPFTLEIELGRASQRHRIK